MYTKDTVVKWEVHGMGQGSATEVIRLRLNQLPVLPVVYIELTLYTKC